MLKPRSAPPSKIQENEEMAQKRLAGSVDDPNHIVAARIVREWCYLWPVVGTLLSLAGFCINGSDIYFTRWALMYSVLCGGGHAARLRQ
jgi:hypothetical protein